MAEKTPLRLVLNGGTPTGIAEYQTGDTIGNSFLTNSSFNVLDNTSTSTSISLGDSLQIIGTGGITTSLTGSVLTIAVGGSIVTETSTDLLTNKTLGATTIAGHLTPDSNEAYDLGSASFKFRDLYLSGTSINLGDATITASGSSIVLPAGTTVSGGSGETVDLNSTQELTNKTVNLSSNTLTGTTAEFNTALSDANFVTQDGSGNVTVSGNLTVNGTTTTVATTNTTISDNLLELNSGAASNANDTGILIERGSTGDNAIIVWDESADKFVVGTTTATASDTGDLTISTGTLVANVEGNVTGDVTGNADTATSLETARTIAGQSFDGTANITIASTDLSNSSNITLNDATQTLTNKTFDANGTGNSISNIEVADLATGVLDTDLSTVSASDDTLASAKAIKAYVDSQVTAIDVDIAADTGTIAITDAETLTFTGGTGIDTSATGNAVTFSISNGGVDTTQLADSAVTNAKLANSSISFTDESSTAGSVSLGGTLEFLAGEGINTTASGATLTITAEDATSANKGIASFDATDFTVSSGDVTLNAERVQDIAGAMFSSNTETLITATYQDADGTIDLVVDNDLSNYDNTTSGFITASSSETLTNKVINASQLVDGSVSNAKLANNSVSFTDESSTAGSVSLGGTLEFLTGEGINTTASGNTLTIAAEDASTSNKGVASFETNDFTVTSGAVSIKSGSIENDDLAGSITNDKLTNSTITVAGNTGSQAIDLGDTLTIQGTTNEIETSQSGDTLTIGLPDDVTIGNNLIVSGNLTVSGTTTTVNTETINLADNTITLNSNETGTPSQDGGIEIERGTSTNKTLIWNETTDKWTVGSETFVAGTFEGNLTGDVTGNADTATSLETARTIGGVSFDGTTNIDLPGVNTTGNQDTSGNAATATTLETPRTIAGQSFDGSSNITIASTDLSNSSNITLNDATQTLTNKTFDANGTGNSISNIEVADLAAGVLDTDISSVSASDDTLASAKAIKAYVDNQVGSISTILTVSDDTSTTDQVTVGTDILNFAGGDGIQTTVSNNTVTIDFTNIDLNA